MDLVQHFAGMARNNAWSNRRLQVACLSLQPGELAAERTSFFPSLIATLNHILIVDWYYIDALEKGGRGPALYADRMPCPALPDLIAAQRRSDRRLIAFCDRLSPRRLEERVPMLRDGRTAPPERIGALLAHLFVHQIHHRGQVHAMLSGTSVRPPQLDEFFMDDDARFRTGEVEALDGPD